MLRIDTSGNFNNLESFLNDAKHAQIMSLLDNAGKQGVQALKDYTPVESGKTAASWSYEIEKTSDGYTVSWTNSNVNDGANVAILIQMGHGTRQGGYVQGIDYINPAMAEVFEKISYEIWKGVSGL